MEDWKQVVFSYKSPFELYPPPIGKNDVFWAKNPWEVASAEVPKLSPAVMVWGAMSFFGLSKLHIGLQGQTVNQDYYCSEILKGDLFPRLEKNYPRGV